MTVVVGPVAPGEDGPIPVVVGRGEHLPGPGGMPGPVPGSGYESGYDSVYEDEVTRDGAAQRVIRVATDVYGDGLDLARRCASQAMRRLGDLGDGLRPDEIELQVSVTLDAGMAAVVKAGAEAQLQVTFRWQPGGPAPAVVSVSGPGSGPAVGSATAGPGAGSATAGSDDGAAS
ncbi:CU044_2847 family protein [Streptomyces sp. NPDC057617]|uniref:CU044_2847 family protein n=1 Tax=Streptomyces sp. NPDC057617 TaxID=3346184 RepID=UPI003699FF95